MTAGERWSAAFASAGRPAAEIYDDIMVPRLFDPWAELLLGQLKPGTGERLLDVACGTGSVTRLAAALLGTSGRVTGCDVSPAMLAVARSKVGAPVDYLQCSADALAVPSAAYDVVTCQHGLQFFPDRRRALAEMRRVLRPGGRLGLAVWCSIEQCPPFAALATALAEVAGDELATAYRDGPWGLADVDVVALAEEAGFTGVRVARHRLPVVFHGGSRQLMQTLAATGVAAQVAALDAQTLLDAVAKAAAPLMAAGSVRSEMAARLITCSS